jgi:hypothetical protein
MRWQPRKFRAYNRGKRVWAIVWYRPNGQNVHRYTLTSGVVCSDWTETATEANEIIRTIIRIG